MQTHNQNTPEISQDKIEIRCVVLTRVHESLNSTTEKRRNTYANGRISNPQNPATNKKERDKP